MCSYGQTWRADDGSLPHTAKVISYSLDMSSTEHRSSFFLFRDGSYVTLRVCSHAVAPSGGTQHRVLELTCLLENGEAAGMRRRHAGRAPTTALSARHASTSVPRHIPSTSRCFRRRHPTFGVYIYIDEALGLAWHAGSTSSR